MMGPSYYVYKQHPGIDTVQDFLIKLGIKLHMHLLEIYNFRMGRFSGMEISSSPGLKNPQKLAQGRKILSSQGP